MSTQSEGQRPGTFVDLCNDVEKVAKGLGFFLNRKAPKIDGMKHVGWYCPRCDQRLHSCNSTGHHSGNFTGDCKVPGERLVPMYVPRKP